MTRNNFIKNYRARKEKRQLELKQNKFEEDVLDSMDSIMLKLGKEYRIDPKVRVGRAVDNIWGDLDIAFTYGGADTDRFEVINTSIDRLGLNEIKDQLLTHYFVRRYLHIMDPNHELNIYGSEGQILSGLRDYLAQEYLQILNPLHSWLMEQALKRARNPSSATA